MKILFPAIVTCLILNSCASEPTFFNGKISLETRYYDSLGIEVDAKLIGRDSEMHYYVAGGNYKSLNQDSILTQLYNSATNQYYFANQNQFQMVDATYKHPVMGKVTEPEGTETVLGKACKKVTIQSESETTTYYYSDELRVDKSLYTKHNFWNWNLFMEASGGGVPLKYVIEFPAMTVVMEAYEIEELDLTADDFNIESYVSKK